MAFVIAEELKKLPEKPGVYLMHDRDGAVLYVGKAVNLKNRVRQYFVKTVSRGPQILSMITQIAWFETIVVDSETDALVLESNLIKEHHPPYNTKLMDDAAYPYICLTLGETYPRLTVERSLKRNKNAYFGPYPNGRAVRETIDLLERIFCLRSCRLKLPENAGKQRPCLKYQMHRCPAPCTGKVPPEKYREQVRKAEHFLKGHYETVIAYLKDRMLAASAILEFEEAARLRDLLRDVQSLQDRQVVTDTAAADRDVLGLASENGQAIAEVFFVRGGRMIGRNHFHLEVGAEDACSSVLSQFIKQFYGGTPFLPGEIFTSEQPEDKELLENYLSTKAGHRVELLTPKRGEKMRLLELAGENALHELHEQAEQLKREAARTLGAQQGLARLLGLEQLSRIESYDISDISGFSSVGSMVVYESGQPRKNEYRKFKIKFVEGADDCASLAEVLTRRFTEGLQQLQALRENGLEEPEGFRHFPDLILMDGGRGQVHVALEVLGRLGLDIPVCGMVKDDRHRTRGLFYRDEEVPIDTRSEEFKLVTRIQDETHRFAITFHQKLRSREQTHSVLDEIPGIGPARRQALQQAMKNRDTLKNATIEQLAAVPKMNRTAAETVYAFFHDGVIEEAPEGEEK